MRLFWYEIIETLFKASLSFLAATVFLEWARPGFVVLYIPLIWILLPVLGSGIAIAILHKK